MGLGHAGSLRKLKIWIDFIFVKRIKAVEREGRFGDKAVNPLCPRFLRGQLSAFQGIRLGESDVKWVMSVGKAPHLLSTVASNLKITQKRILYRKKPSKAKNQP